MDHTDPTKGFKTPSRKKDYEASEDENAVKLWHLGPPFLGSRPPGATRPSFDQAKEAKIQMIAKKIKAGIEAKTSDSDSGSDGTTMDIIFLPCNARDTLNGGKEDRIPQNCNYD